MDADTTLAVGLERAAGSERHDPPVRLNATAARLAATLQVGQSTLITAPQSTA